jgi:spermidine/putrescine-binding protein
MTKPIGGPDDLVRIRIPYSIDRRSLIKGAAATGTAAGLGMLSRPAAAATTLNYVGWEGYDTFLEAGEYPQANDVTLQKSFISAPDEIVTKLRLNSSQVDLCTPFSIHNDFLANTDLLEPLDLSKIPNFEHIHPTVLKYCEANMSEGGNWYAAPMTYGAICMMYNADEIPEPTSWTDMLKDEYKGKCAITSDYPGNIFAWARVAGVEQPSHMTYEELDKTVELLIDLKKNHLRTIASSYGDLINLLANKEIVIGQGWEPVSVWVGEEVNVKVAYPQEKCMGFIEGYAIGRGSANVDAAHAIINHALSVEGQLAGADWNTMPVVNAEAMSQVGELNQALYRYDNLEAYFTEKTLVMPMYPLEADGTHPTWDEYQAAWERVLKA